MAAAAAAAARRARALPDRAPACATRARRGVTAAVQRVVVAVAHALLFTLSCMAAAWALGWALTLAQQAAARTSCAKFVRPRIATAWTPDGTRTSVNRMQAGARVAKPLVLWLPRVAAAGTRRRAATLSTHAPARACVQRQMRETRKFHCLLCSHTFYATVWRRIWANNTLRTRCRQVSLSPRPRPRRRAAGSAAMYRRHMSCVIWRHPSLEPAQACSLPSK